VPLDCTAAEDRLTQVRRKIAHLEGRREQMAARRDILARAVGLAKARLTLKPKVDTFLEALQHEAHEKAIGSYERMLTAIVQDVLPQPGLSIRLRLQTERGLPALDIEAVKDGQAVDIIEGCGGSVTNVLSLGLRTVATVKSGLRSFLALDEPDCWIKPDRVRVFYGVVKRMATSMGFQALIISHHDVGLFDAGINVISVTGNPSDGLAVESRAGAAAWPDGETPGIRSIRLKGVSSYADATFLLAPGLNAAIGDNNIGKSQVMRFLRAAAYGGGETTDDIVRHHQKRAEGWFTLENGRVLSYSREPKRNPINLWRLTGADGAVVEVDGTRCESGGREAPGWVAKTLGIARMDGLDLQLAHQKFPVFLLKEPASQRAAVLSLGQESGHLRDMIQAHKNSCAQDGVTVKTGEIEMAALVKALDGMACSIGTAQDAEMAAARLAAARAESARGGLVEAASVRISSASAQLLATEARLAALVDLPSAPAVEETLARARAVAAGADRIASAFDSLTRSEAQIDAVAGLPDAAPAIGPCDLPAAAARRIATASAARSLAERMLGALDGLPPAAPVIASTARAVECLGRIRASSSGLAAADAQLAVLDALPDAAPTVHATASASALADRVQASASGLAAAKAGLAATEAEAAAAEAEFDDAMLAMGGSCPLCGSGLAHAHGHDAEVA